MSKFLSALVFGLSLACAAHAQDMGEWQEGKHYELVATPQATTTGDKVEVLEAFSYACPACNQAVPIVADIKKALPANAEFVYLPVQFASDAWKTFARGFYTAQALGIAEKAHADLFRAIYLDKKINSSAPTMDALAAFYANYGVSAADFLATSKSFAIETKLKRNEALVKALGIDGTPAFVVNGKYRVSGRSAGGYDKLGALINHLVAKESAGR
ncbi:thiol:disulfide interchange protein DsbA/DsbL [Dokdonella sp.]|uniref:thiol:disulfide interchange protein DsbA/DsbL n=1 Tax=Dokdonella sp. TaxID=2291710 RepID=UPI0025BEA9BC|nr:thiol:disulfide interchange protein DsbA/DsbL [Dokdonella sp.]MBX3691811.1 thiol:disulfide interchange protein DsbA/DsbL [Dokdonella sp.]MCW5568707.1 thiol:disulfide interchange protein DsbA/DsbL [Dokdonella sp.]